MEKVRPWCGQPSDRGRLKNRTEHHSSLTDVHSAVLHLLYGTPWLLLFVHSLQSFNRSKYHLKLMCVLVVNLNVLCLLSTKHASGLGRKLDCCTHCNSVYVCV